MEPGKLSRLQQEVLDAFFERETRFFLTGGAALAGFMASLAEIARKFKASFEPIQTSPDFRRFLIRRGEEAVVVDLVRERGVQARIDKAVINGIRVDPPEEILANKLCTLLSRSELRDLVDVRALERAGYRVEVAIPSAMKKDGGLTPAQLGWVLSQIEIGDELTPPGGVSAVELRQYLIDLIDRLTRLAYPT